MVVLVRRCEGQPGYFFLVETTPDRPPEPRLTPGSIGTKPASKAGLDWGSNPQWPACDNRSALGKPLQLCKTTILTR